MHNLLHFNFFNFENVPRFIIPRQNKLLTSASRTTDKEQADVKKTAVSDAVISSSLFCAEEEQHAAKASASNALSPPFPCKA